MVSRRLTRTFTRPGQKIVSCAVAWMAIGIAVELGQPGAERSRHYVWEEVGE